ncbi:hypothetical protein M6B38_320970 [Iris pallida]|uniref:Uncharacterized protein n=1 Tax=Iris pallida TaxID=29817 RepID=A0AAX6HDK9_IRIPA|nr:hypothetical protein M6B38_320970 [Iris pallida]
MYIYEGPYTSYIYSWHDYVLVLHIWDWGVTCFCGGPCRSSLPFWLHD